MFALPRLILALAMLVLAGVWTGTVYGLEFSNPGHDAVRRLFFVANGYQYKGSGNNAEKAKVVAVRYGLSQCQAYLEERGLLPQDYRLKSLGKSGVVRVLYSEPLEASFQGNNLVGARVIGEIQFEISPAMAERLPEILTIAVASDQKKYRSGENLVFMLHGNMKFYGSLLDLNPAGELIQLLPNGTRKQSSFDRGVRYKFPDRRFGDDFNLAVGAPFGLERIRVIGSDVPLGPILDAESYGVGFGVVQHTFKWVEKVLMERVVARLKKDAPQSTFRCLQVYEGSVTLTTSEYGSK
jgi:hypothetical protein